MYSTYLRLGLHVSASDTEVIRAIHKKFAKKHRYGPKAKADRRQIYEIMLRYHREARSLYRDVMLGQIDDC